MTPGSAAWFARHEVRLAWRDWIALMTAGRRRRTSTVAVGLAIFAVALHGLAWLMLPDGARLAAMPARDLALTVTGALIATASLMLSQALESVTRTFYARGDLELILTSPSRTPRLFGVRIANMAATTMFVSLVLTAPFINVLAWRGGVRWLGAYAAAASLAMLTVALSVVVIGALFRTIGPRRTRAVAQVFAAVVGAAFAIAMQVVALATFGTITMPGIATLDSHLPGPGSPAWWPAQAVMGEPAALLGLLATGGLALGAVIALAAPRFGQLALAAGGEGHGGPVHGTPRTHMRRMAPAQALRRKEWTLLLRDPWLLSQTLMQLLYLMPAALLLWLSFSGDGGASVLLVPILIVTAGQLAGGLAWLAVSGEDAPDLIATAPITRRRALRAKAEAVMGGIAIVFLPFVALLAVAMPFAALVAFVVGLAAAGAATAIQFWFRAQARRSLFRQRQVSSRVATFAEALSSILLAATGATVMVAGWLALAPAAVVLLLLAGAWMISPTRTGQE